jgi:uncharacterized membrane protein YfcA
MSLAHIIASRVSASTAVGVVCAVAIAARGGGGGGSSFSAPAPLMTMGFTDTALVSNKVGVVATTILMTTALASCRQH